MSRNGYSEIPSGQSGEGETQSLLNLEVSSRTKKKDKDDEGRMPKWYTFGILAFGMVLGASSVFILRRPDQPTSANAVSERTIQQEEIDRKSVV